jgi:hypothetical protein
MYLAIDIRLAYAARDQLGVLGAKIQYQDLVRMNVMHIEIFFLLISSPQMYREHRVSFFGYIQHTDLGNSLLKPYEPLTFIRHNMHTYFSVASVSLW